MASYLAKDNIRVNTIVPGYIWSGIHEGRMKQADRDKICGLISMGRFGRNEEIANAVLFFASDASSYITGLNLPVYGGYMTY